MKQSEFTPQEVLVIINAVHRHYHVATQKLLAAETQQEEDDALEVIKYCKQILEKCYTRG